MPVFTDQLGKAVSIPKRPQRIISLVPSQTELLFDLGLTNEVVGITKFCIHPVEWFRTKTRIGGTKKVNIEKVNSLKPDLIIANKEENMQEQVDELSKKFPVWTSDISTLEAALEMIKNIGAITGTEKQAQTLVQKIQTSFQKILIPVKRYSAAYLIWKDPYMTIGGDTFINDMLHRAGFENVFAHQKRYPSISIDQLQSVKPEVILLSSEPYPFKQQHLDAMSAQLPGAKIILANGEMFSWYGSRLQYAAAYFDELREKIEHCP